MLSIVFPEKVTRSGCLETKEPMSDLCAVLLKDGGLGIPEVVFGYVNELWTSAGKA
jgi:hypothetical protein